METVLGKGYSFTLTRVYSQNLPPAHLRPPPAPAAFTLAAVDPGELRVHIARLTLLVVVLLS